MHRSTTCDCLLEHILEGAKVYILIHSAEAEKIDKDGEIMSDCIVDCNAHAPYNHMRVQAVCNYICAAAVCNSLVRAFPL